MKGTLECEICHNSFQDVKTFRLHLVWQHFEGKVLKKLQRDRDASYKTGDWRCPSCRVVVTADQNAIVEHYGALCPPFPVQVSPEIVVWEFQWGVIILL